MIIKVMWWVDQQTSNESPDALFWKLRCTENQESDCFITQQPIPPQKIQTLHYSQTEELSTGCWLCAVSEYKLSKQCNTLVYLSVNLLLLQMDHFVLRHQIPHPNYRVDNDRWCNSTKKMSKYPRCVHCDLVRLISEAGFSRSYIVCVEKCS